MKNIHKIAMLLATAIVTMVSCDKEGRMSGKVSSKDIIPVVKNGAQTKAGIEGIDQLAKGFKMDIIIDEDYIGGKAGKYGRTRTVSNEDGTGWVFDTLTRWVNEVPMRFWSYNNNIADQAKIQAQKAKQSVMEFSYPAEGVTPDGQSDLLLAYTAKTFSAGADDKLPVAFKHAISCISFKNELTSIDGGIPEGYIVTSITLSRLSDAGKCTFDGESGEISWSELSGSSKFTVKSNGVPATSKSFLIIPQNPSDNDASIQLTLTKEGEPDIVLVKKMPSVNMEAGKNYGFNLKVTPGRELEMEVFVAPWTYEDRTLELKEKSVSMYLNKDTYSNGIISSADATIFIDRGMAVKGKFQLSSPMGAKILLSLDGNIDAFKVEPKIAYVTEEPIEFSITPMVNDPKIDYHTQLHVFLVLPDSSVSNLDEQIMIENEAFKPYTIILPKL